VRLRSGISRAVLLLPATFLLAGMTSLSAAQRQPDRRQECAICHLDWVEAFDRPRVALLVDKAAHPTATDSSLCLGCHDSSVKDSRRQVWLAHGHRTAVQPPPTMKVPPELPLEEGRLACRTCHTAHGGAPAEQLGERFFLRVPNDKSQLCLMCHPDQRTVLATKHDLRTSQPQLHNRSGLTTGKSGPCGACHLAHGPARTPRPTPIDPTGVCASCHRTGGPLGKKGDMQFSHPVACLTCHDPHGGSRGGFVKETRDKLCLNCHGDPYGQLADGPHDVRSRQKVWPVPVTSDGRCSACHVMHSADPEKRLWTTPLGVSSSRNDAVCLGCHKKVGWPEDNPGLPQAVMHPRSSIPTSQAARASTGPALATASAPTSAAADRMECRTCHDPHAGAAPLHLLRSATASQPARVCFGCHEGAAGIDFSMHSPQALKQIRHDQRTCGPCHAVHAIPEGSSRDKLWVSKLGTEGASLSEQRCLGCHGPGGTALRPTLFRHPESFLEAVNWEEICEENPDLKPLPAGRVTCLTCHLPHGRRAEPTTQASLVQVYSVKTMLRSGVSQSFCSICHGFDAIRNYLYYHFPEKRQ
jgi:predicted CXXCH cytochrome family protein